MTKAKPRNGGVVVKTVDRNKKSQNPCSNGINTIIQLWWLLYSYSTKKIYYFSLYLIVNRIESVELFFN